MRITERSNVDRFVLICWFATIRRCHNSPQQHPLLAAFVHWRDT